MKFRIENLGSEVEAAVANLKCLSGYGQELNSKLSELSECIDAAIRSLRGLNIDAWIIRDNLLHVSTQTSQLIADMSALASECTRTRTNISDHLVQLGSEVDSVLSECTRLRKRIYETSTNMGKLNDKIVSRPKPKKAVPQ